MGEESFFVLSSKMRSMTMSGSLNVRMLDSSSGLWKPREEVFDALEPAVTGICSSSRVVLYSSKPARLLGVTMTW